MVYRGVHVIHYRFEWTNEGEKKTETKLNWRSLSVRLILVSDWQQEQQTSPNSFNAFCFEIPLSVSVLPSYSSPPYPFSPGKYPHPLHCHHGDTWPVTSLCCSSVLVSLFFLFYCLSLCFVWLIMSGLSNSVSIYSSFDLYTFYTWRCFISVLFFWLSLVCFFSTVNFLLI